MKLDVWSVGWGRECLLRNLPLAGKAEVRCHPQGSAGTREASAIGGIGGPRTYSQTKGKNWQKGLSYKSRENGEKPPEEAGGRRQVSQQRKGARVCQNQPCPLGHRAAIRDPEGFGSRCCPAISSLCPPSNFGNIGGLKCVFSL